MIPDQILFFVIITGVFAFFLWGRWRYDLVAFAALLVSVFTGLIPADIAFEGFSHPAVITVAAVLIISRGIANSGAIERFSDVVTPPLKNLSSQIGVISSFAAALSAMMNNVAALALLMPSTMESAKKAKRSPALLLMPLSFGSILGGLITLIGTPPNIVIGNYRTDALGAPFTMFDFAPVGLALALVGVAYLAFIGWRFLPKERQAQSAPEDLFNIDAYTSEVIVAEGSKAVDLKLPDLHDIAAKCEVQVLSLIRNHQPLSINRKRTTLKEKDGLLILAGPKELDVFIHELDLQVRGELEKKEEILSLEELMLVEAVISPDSRLIGRVMGDLRMRSRYGLNVMGISRQGTIIKERLHKVSFEAGDILLIQGDEDSLSDTLSRLKLLPLSERGFQMGKRSQALLAVGLLAGALALTGFGFMGLTIALALAAFGMVATSIVPMRDMYDAIDWPVIVLVGCMIPIGGAFETTGATALVTDIILTWSEGQSPVFVLGLLFIITMTLSDLMNNVATAVMMAPIGIGLASALSVNPDTFLMAVAVSSSCAFLTPIGHKNNALVMGPGGYKFGDYWRVGLPLEIIIVIIGLPVLLWAWPL